MPVRRFLWKNIWRSSKYMEGRFWIPEEIRIRDVEVTNEHFEREMCEYKYDNDDENICVNVKLKISKNAEYRVYDEFQDAEKTADGDFIVNMSYPENEWLYGYIMSFGEYAEVLEPTYIRDIIKTKIEKMINNYL